MLGFLYTIISAIIGGFTDVISFIAFLAHGVSAMAHLAGSWASMTNSFLPLPLQAFAAVSLTIMIVRLCVSLGGH